MCEEQGRKVMLSVFLISHIIMRFFSQQVLLSSLSYLDKPLTPHSPQDKYMSCPRALLLHIPQPSMPMVRATPQLLVPVQCCTNSGLVCSPSRLCSVQVSSVSVVGRTGSE